MNIFKNLHKVAVFSALVLYGLSATNPANAALTSPVAVPAGTCDGATGDDCVTTTGHISASVVSTLDINEVRAVSFGNMKIACTTDCDGLATLVLSPTGTRTAAAGGGTDVITPMHGADANDGSASAAGNVLSGSQQPGIYAVTGGNEGSAASVYIAVADASGNFINFSGDSIYPAANSVTLTGPGTQTFKVDSFTLACLDAAAANVTTTPSADVYGHYCPTDGGAIKVALGATLHTVLTSTGVTAYTAGKYTGTFNVMVSY